MVLLNFSHPLTAEQLRQLAELARAKVDRTVEIDAQIDPQQPIVPQVAAMADRAGLTPQEWQTLPILINPPSLNFSAVTLLAELHGRCGYFPAAVRLRPVPGSVPPRFEVAEIVNLQAVREEARKGRQ
ncbi:MAG: CRISPR-associated protein Csx15 [Thermoanaerobacteraceae bacterium]|nr:CRISPR-associated protein Csx15 [Thermoanaerobacteraceae bacterium]